MSGIYHYDNAMFGYAAENDTVAINVEGEQANMPLDAWYALVRDINNDIQAERSRRNVIVDSQKMKISVTVNAGERLGFIDRAYWRKVAFRGTYYVNIDHKAGHNLGRIRYFTYSQPEWEHIVRGYYRYRDSAEWKNRRNRERNTSGEHPAIYVRAAFGKLPNSPAYYDWHPEADQDVLSVILGTPSSWRSHSPPRFTGEEFEAIVAAVEDRIEKAVKQHKELYRV